MNTPELKEFIQLFNDSDRNAFELLYKKLSPDLFDFVKKIMGSREEAEDIVAESFYKLWIKPKNFETIQNINSFLHITCRNACFDRMKHSKIELANREFILENILKSYEESDKDRELEVLLLNKIYSEMEKLPAKTRDVIKLSYIGDLKNAEIARRLGTNEKTIRNQKANALKRLRLSVLASFGI